MTILETDKKLVKTTDGRPWVQPCYVCHKVVNFLHKDAYVRVGELVRHRKCYPEAAK